MSDYYIPHLKRNLPRGSKPLLTFRIFSAHSTEKVIDSMNSNNIPFIHLPPNCTPIVQPLDVGVNGPFKAKIKQKFTDWLVNRYDDIIYHKTDPNQKFHKAASDYEIVEWIIEAWNELSEELIRNSNVLNSK